MRPIFHRRPGRPGSRAAVFISLLLFAAVFFGVPAYAQGSGTETVRVGYYENEVFQEGAQEGAVRTGYAYEYYRKLSEYTGWKYEYVYGKFGDLYQMLLDGEIDLLAGLAFREERAELIGYPRAAMGNESYSLVRHDSDVEVTSDPASLNGKKIGVLESAMQKVLEQYLADNGVSAEVLTFKDYEQLFSAFDSGGLDILAAEGDGAYGRDHAEVVCAFGASDYYLCVNIHRPDLLEELDRAQMLLSVEEPNYVNSLRMKYYPVSLNARAFSAVEREWLDTHGSLRVGYLENYLPYSDTDENGEATGIVRNIFPEIAEQLGISGLSIDFTGYESYDAMIADMNAGAIDAVFPVGGGLYYSEESGIYQSNPVASSSTNIIYRGEFREDVLKRIAVNQNNRMQ